MSDEFMGDRRKALEEEFFRRETEKKMTALRQKLERDATREGLARVSGMDDAALLDNLVDLGVTPHAYTVVNLVPLIEVAWADGHMHAAEREAILKGAAEHGIDAGTPSYELLASWLDERPRAELFSVWEAYVGSLARQMDRVQLVALRDHIVGMARGVAEAAGGFLGIGSVAEEEERVLVRVAAAFAE